MFDAGRILVFAWAFVCVVRARAWLGAVALLVAAYLFALGVASGFTVRAEGPMSPIVAVLLALMGPSALPRGKLPPLPFATFVVHAPAIVNVVACVALVVVARRMTARVEHLPQFSMATHRLSRAALALVLVAVFEGFAASIRVLPELLDWGAGSIGVLPAPTTPASRPPGLLILHTPAGARSG